MRRRKKKKRRGTKKGEKKENLKWELVASHQQMEREHGCHTYYPVGRFRAAVHLG